jgi:predicted RNA binding protein YcfA (HicA-like mRNA interferase family)
MPRIPGISQQDAVRVFEKAGFRVKRQGKHIIMARGRDILVIPRHNPIDACTMGGIAKAAGLTPEQFRSLL